MDKFAPQG